MKLLYPLFLLFIHLSLTAQNESNNPHFLIEEEKFSPPVEAMIRQFEGGPVTPIIADDIFGNKVEINEYQGIKTCMVFCNFKDGKNIELLDQFNQWTSSQTKRIKIIFFVDDMKNELEYLTKEQVKNILIIPNSKMLSEAVYGVEIGVPRLFFLDEMGNVQKVFPTSFFTQIQKLFLALDQLVLQ